MEIADVDIIGGNVTCVEIAVPSYSDNKTQVEDAATVGDVDCFQADIVDNFSPASASIDIYGNYDGDVISGLYFSDEMNNLYYILNPDKLKYNNYYDAIKVSSKI